MKITNNKIYDTVKEVVGEDSLKVVEFLKDKKNISDFKIAEKVKTDIHEIRNILYRLYNHNLVTYYRKKDRQKGWYISYWTFNKKRIKDLMKQLHYSKMERFTQRLREEKAKNFLKKAFQGIDNKLSENCFDNYGNFSFGMKEHIVIPGTKYIPELGIYGMGISVTLGRPGYRVKRRHRTKSKVGLRHVLTLDEAKLFIKDEFEVEIAR